MDTRTFPSVDPPSNERCKLLAREGVTGEKLYPHGNDRLGSYWEAGAWREPAVLVGLRGHGTPVGSVQHQRQATVTYYLPLIDGFLMRGAAV